MGFNNVGVDRLVCNVECVCNCRGLFGINIGKNKDIFNEQVVDDYIVCLDKVYLLVDYIIVNIFLFNIVGLCELQEEIVLCQLVSQLCDCQEDFVVCYG